MGKNNVTTKLFLTLASVTIAGCSLEQPKKEAEKKATAPAASDVTLTWDGSTDGSIVSFKVFLGGEEGETGSLIETIDATLLDFNTDEPSGILNTAKNKTLGEYVGKKSCFAIAAVDQDGKESVRSTPVCVNL